MVKRTFWLSRIEQAWKKRSLVWLSGVRRAGKTVLCQMVNGAEYFDCELPRVRRMLEDAESFLEAMKGERIVLDEVHRLENPAEVLKIAADHFPTVRVLATGSSMLGASAKFKDTLAGRKAEIRLTPMTSSDLVDFEKKDLKFRLHRGGLPPFFLSKTFPETDFQEWMDAYWAKDILELFRLERRSSFQKFVELILTQNGGIFDATRFAKLCEVSRTTIMNYLAVLEATLVAHVVRPFSTHRASEIVKAPKVYGLDTGFVAYHKGWHELRCEDLGNLWEQYVLNEVQAILQIRTLRYWRNKRGHEVDFIFTSPGVPPVAIECKWRSSDFDPKNLLAFRKEYPEGKNLVVSPDIERPFSRKCGNLPVLFSNLTRLIEELRDKSH